MIMMECVQDSGHYYDIEIFGTDLDTEAIASARKGVYSANIIHDVGEKRILQPFSLGFSLTNRPTNQGSKSFRVNNHLVHIFP
jgi:chemotaxis methyl-accepting protein methylase